MILDNKNKRLMYMVGLKTRPKGGSQESNFSLSFSHFTHGNIPLCINWLEPSFKVQINKVSELYKGPSPFNIYI